MPGYFKTPARLLPFLLAISVADTGCHGTSRRAITGSTASSSGEPILQSGGDVVGSESATIAGAGSGVTIVEPTVPAASSSVDAMSWVDRHPLLRKPQQYYESTKSSNKLVKTAAATFVGVPAGFVGELKQIVVGKPSATVY